MADTTINQASAAPTSKVTAAAVGAVMAPAIVAILQAWLSIKYPWLRDPTIWETLNPLVLTGVAGVGSFIGGYFKREEGDTSKLGWRTLVIGAVLFGGAIGLALTFIV